MDSNRQLALALVRLLEIIGEAATRVPEAERARLPGIPWRQIAAMRNRLIHAYDAVDLSIVWQILEGDLPRLIVALENAGIT
ncbi:MAG: HepT-like ribonuclease domain-containing protein, partial [Terracidiphilus sp.]